MLIEPRGFTGPRLLHLCDCPWHPCTHNPPPQDWRYHLFGRIPIGPTVVDVPWQPRTGRLWRWLGSTKTVSRG